MESSSSSAVANLSFDLSRETLKAMICLEQKYYRCTNYLCPDVYEREEDAPMDTSIQEQARRNSSSSLNMIAEMASLVTDLRLTQPCNAEDAYLSGQDVQDKTFGDTSPWQCRAILDSTPDFSKVLKKEVGNVPSPNSSTDNIYSKTPEDGVALSNSDPTRKLMKRRRPSALEVSNLSNWRQQMLDWTLMFCHKIFHENSTTISSISFNIFDRYLVNVLDKEQTQQLFPEHAFDDRRNLSVFNALPISKEDFGLYCMVSLFIAAKLWIPVDCNPFTVKNLVAISRNYYSHDCVLATERAILVSLKWHVNPPTVMDYCGIYLNLLWNPYEENVVSWLAMRKKCEYFAELMLADVYFLDKANYTVALGIVLLVTNAYWGRGNRRKKQRRRQRRDTSGASTEFLQEIEGVVDIHNAEFDSIVQRLERFL